MTDTMKGIYLECAAGLGLGDLTKLKTTDPKRKQIITECADGYIKATEDGNEHKRSQYISALMLMFWGEIGKMADKCKAVQEYEYDDFASKLYECINTACQYHAWKDGKHTAEACIRSCIASRGAAAILYESNLDKNKANVNNVSLDATVNDDSDGHEVSRLDLLVDENEDVTKNLENMSDHFVQTYLNKNKIIEGIVIDLIANNDCQRYYKEACVSTDVETGEDYKYTKVSSEFWGYRLVQLMSKLPADYFDYFRRKYKVEDVVLQSALDKIKTSNNQKLYKYLELTLEDARTRLKVSKLI